MSKAQPAFPQLMKQIRACTICQQALPHGVRPIVQASPNARILIAGQAPGRKVHESGIPFDDPSGDQLRRWMGVSREQFYDDSLIAIAPMGFCYPGKGSSGDLPPRPECAPAWRGALLAQLTKIELTLVIGRYAQAWHLGKKAGSVTEVVSAWQDYWPAQLPLPHPSPRNRFWMKRNPWFEQQVVPALQGRVGGILKAQ